MKIHMLSKYSEKFEYSMNVEYTILEFKTKKSHFYLNSQQN